MPNKTTVLKAKRAKRAGKAPTTQAGEFVREEIEHVREGKHGARNAKQAIAIGLSKARRAGVPLPAPKKGTTSKATRTKAKRDLAKGQTTGTRAKKVSRSRSRATLRALSKEGSAAASPRALSRQARSAAARRKATGKAPQGRTTKTTRPTTRAPRAVAARTAKSPRKATATPRASARTTKARTTTRTPRAAAPRTAKTPRATTTRAKAGTRRAASRTGRTGARKPGGRATSAARRPSGGGAKR